MQKKSFNMDLNTEEGSTTSVAAVDNVEVPEIAEKSISEAVMLPIPSYNADGVKIVTTKNIEVLTGDEMLSWIKSVLPMNDELIRKIGNIKDGKGLDTVKLRQAAFKMIVSLHENRWLFNLGKANTATNN